MHYYCTQKTFFHVINHTGEPHTVITGLYKKTVNKGLHSSRVNHGPLLFQMLGNVMQSLTRTDFGAALTCLDSLSALPVTITFTLTILCVITYMRNRTQTTPTSKVIFMWYSAGCARVKAHHAAWFQEFWSDWWRVSISTHSYTNIQTFWNLRERHSVKGWVNSLKSVCSSQAFIVTDGASFWSLSKTWEFMFVNAS